MQVLLNDYVLGAQVATDLINTSPTVMVATGDDLAEPAALQRFIVEHDLDLDSLRGGHVPDAGDVAAAHHLRTMLRSIVEAESSDAVASLGTLTRGVGVGPTLQRVDDRWQWIVESRAHAGLIDELTLLAATALLSVLRQLGHGRFRHCAAPDCNGVFVDTSRAGRRRYCMPDVCGNRVNVANFRARRRTVTDPSSS